MAGSRTVKNLGRDASLARQNFGDDAPGPPVAGALRRGSISREPGIRGSGISVKKRGPEV